MRPHWHVTPKPASEPAKHMCKPRQGAWRTRPRRPCREWPCPVGLGRAGRQWVRWHWGRRGTCASGPRVRPTLKPPAPASWGQASQMKKAEGWLYPRGALRAGGWWSTKATLTLAPKPQPFAHQHLAQGPDGRPEEAMHRRRALTRTRTRTRTRTHTHTGRAQIFEWANSHPSLTSMHA